jgi:predicted nucleotidyltransferase
MGKTIREISAQEQQSYHPADAIRRRKADQKADIVARRNLAWKIAKQAAALLKTDYGATRVVVFGSLVYEDWFAFWSDIDLAAWGISPSEYFKAVAVLLDLHPGMEIDLVDPQNCSPRLRETIERDGIEL